MTKILAVSGSLRRHSLNTALLRGLAEHAPDGIEVEVLEPAELKALEPYDQDDDNDAPPAGAVALRAKVKAADALLISTPEYNGTVPGQVKHLIDWTSRPRGEEAALYSKPVGVISLSPSDYGALWAGDAARRAFGIAGARVVEDVDLAIGGANAKFDAEGALQDEELIGRLLEVLTQLSHSHRATAH